MDLAMHIDAVKSQAVTSLMELIRIKSEAGDPVTTADGQFYPFGQGVQDAFAYMLSKGEEHGFTVENIDNYGGHIDFGDGDETVGVLGHLDVVPASADEWDLDPYCGEEVNGCIWGRGTTDDKGPLLAAFYAMKALKDAGYQPSRKIRLVLGLDEETGWAGMKYYLDKVAPPDFGFTPDADFPVINGEKGAVSFDIVRKLSSSPAKGLALSRLSGGSARNIVAGSARAVLTGDQKGLFDRIREEAEVYHQTTGNRLRLKNVGKALEITATGIPAHAAHPHLGKNAISILFDFMGRLNFASEDVNEFIDFYNRAIGFETDGSSLGCGFSDEESGALTVNVGFVNYTKDSISICMDIRYPVTYHADQVFDAMRPLLDRYNLGLVKRSGAQPLYLPPDSGLVQTLMSVYREKTGDMEHGPVVIGGGTYAKACPNTVAFGGLFPGDPDLMHQKNEKIEIRRFYQMIEIYTEALYRLTQPDFSPEA